MANNYQPQNNYINFNHYSQFQNNNNYNVFAPPLRQRQKTAPNKALPNKPLKPLPTLPNGQIYVRRRSKSDVYSTGNTNNPHMNMQNNQKKNHYHHNASSSYTLNAIKQNGNFSHSNNNGQKIYYFDNPIQIAQNYNIQTAQPYNTQPQMAQNNNFQIPQAQNYHIPHHSNNNNHYPQQHPQQHVQRQTNHSYTNRKQKHNKIRSKTPDPKPSANYKKRQQKVSFSPVGPLTPTQSTSNAYEDAVNRLNKKYSESQSDYDIADVVDDESVSHSDSNSQTYSYNDSRSNKSSNSKKNYHKFGPPKLQTIEKSYSEQPPSKLHRKKPESPRYRPDQLLRMQQQKALKHKKVATPPPISTTRIRMRIFSTPNQSKSHDMPHLAVSATSNVGHRGSIGNGYDTNVFNYDGTRKMNLNRVKSDTLYTTNQYQSTKQKQKYHQQNVPPPVDMEELMAQHNQQQSFLVDKMQRNGNNNGSSHNLNKRINAHQSVQNNENISKQLPASFNKYQLDKQQQHKSMSPSPSIITVSPEKSMDSMNAAHSPHTLPASFNKYQSDKVQSISPSPSRSPRPLTFVSSVSSVESPPPPPMVSRAVTEPVANKYKIQVFDNNKEDNSDDDGIEFVNYASMDMDTSMDDDFYANVDDDDESNYYQNAADDYDKKSDKNGVEKPKILRRRTEGASDTMSGSSDSVQNKGSKKKRKSNKKKWFHGIFGKDKKNKKENDKWQRATFSGSFSPNSKIRNSKKMSDVYEDQYSNSFSSAKGTLVNEASMVSSNGDNESVHAMDGFDGYGKYDAFEKHLEDNGIKPIFEQDTLTNKQIAQNILSMHDHEWNFNNDIVNVYRAQCANVSYEDFIPSLPQIAYPTITSSLSLPITAQTKSYRIECKYNLRKLLNAAKMKQSEMQNEDECIWNELDLTSSVSSYNVNKRHNNDYNSMLFDHHKREIVNDEDVESVSCECSHQCTTTGIIKELWRKICESKHVQPSDKILFSLLDLSNFVLKTIGRSEYLRFEDDEVIVSSKHIRHCLRNNDLNDNTLEFVLIYVYDLNKYDEKIYKKSLKEWYVHNTYNEDIFEFYAAKPLNFDIVTTTTKKKKRKGTAVSNLGVIEENKEKQLIAQQKQIKIKENQVKYEHFGYYSIVETLAKSNQKNKLTQLNLAVEKEVNWLYSTIGRVLEQNTDSSLSKQPSMHSRNGSYSKGRHRSHTNNISYGGSSFPMNQIEIDWEQQQQSAVLLDEFEHPIEIKIKSLKNITNSPRFVHFKGYNFMILRIELMFGSKVFDECSWDIRIPFSQICDNIKIPTSMCTFSSDLGELFYSMLPREAVWCFTVYGVKENEESVDFDNDKKAKKNKKRPKHINTFENDDNLRRAMDDISVSSEFRLFNKRSSSSSSTKYKNRSSPTSPYSNKSSPTSPYTPRGAQLKTKSKYAQSNNSTEDTVSSTASSYKSSSNKSTEMSASPVMGNEHIEGIMEPLAWTRLPVVDHRHCIRRKNISLHLWSVPVFKYRKGGPRVDPYSTDFWKKFGTTRDRQILSNAKTNSNVEKEKEKKSKKKKKRLSKSKKSKNKMPKSKTDIVLNIEFPHFKFDVVAPIVNPRRPSHIAKHIKPYKRKSFPGKEVLHRIIEEDGICPLDDKDKMLVYSNKEKLMRYPEAIPTFLRSVDWLDVELRMEAYDYLERWKRPDAPEDMIELLRHEFIDSRIRLYAINCLNQLDDYTLNRYLLQLVQAIKCELQHNSFLVRFLMYRALKSPKQIGHYFFWHLKSEYHSMGFCERFGLLLEEYLLHLPNNLNNIGINFGKELLHQNNLMNRLTFISSQIQIGKKSKINSKHLRQFYLKELNMLNLELLNHPKSLSLPLDPSLQIIELCVDRCKYMSSAKSPLWLVFNDADIYCLRSIQVMYKSGDDLRQDILTLQLISVMDALWLAKNEDLRMKPYQVIQTGANCGMLELILSASTTNDIHSKHGTIMGSFNNKAHLLYLKSSPLPFKAAQENYARSVAGYSVCSWVLGIGDRHPSNIMIHKNGILFHIDFGHFLGNFKEKQIGGGLIKFNRERSPFVFTSLMKYAIDEGVDDAQLYREFVQWIFKAYSEIRIRFKFFLNLLLLMLPSQMPELIRENDVEYLKDALCLDLTSFQDIAVHVEKTLKLCLNDKYRLVDNGIHATKHAN